MGVSEVAPDRTRYSSTNGQASLALDDDRAHKNQADDGEEAEREVNDFHSAVGLRQRQAYRSHAGRGRLRSIGRAVAAYCSTGRVSR